MELINNDQFSKLNNNDLDELLYIIMRTLIPYRNTLNLDEKLTFGVEIEYDDALFRLVSHYLDKKNLNSWIAKDDDTITKKISDREYTIGGEINSPCLTDNEKCWNELKQVCDMLHDNGASITDNCGGHIHIGSQIFTTSSKFRDLVKVWYVYEHIIFRFGFGEYLKPKSLITCCSQPINSIYTKRKLLMLKGCLPNSEDKLKKNKTGAISFYKVVSLLSELNNTIEIRCPNGTLNPIIWQNNINFFIKLLQAINNNKFDMEYIDYKIEKQKEISNVSKLLKIFNEINLDDYLQLSDIMFDNNLDKIYFLKQYLKEFETVSEFNTKKLQLTK